MWVNRFKSHEITKLECKVKLLYFLRDIGVKAAKEASIEAFIQYMDTISEMAMASMDESLENDDVNL